MKIKWFTDLKTCLEKQDHTQQVSRENEQNELLGTERSSLHFGISRLLVLEALTQVIVVVLFSKNRRTKRFSERNQENTRNIKEFIENNSIFKEKCLERSGSEIESGMEEKYENFHQHKPLCNECLWWLNRTPLFNTFGFGSGSCTSWASDSTGEFLYKYQHTAT